MKKKIWIPTGCILSVGTVPTVCILSVGTVPTGCILSVGTVPTDNLSLTFKLCVIPFLDWWMVEEYSGDGMKL